MTGTVTISTKKNRFPRRILFGSLTGISPFIEKFDEFNARTGDVYTFVSSSDLSFDVGEGGSQVQCEYPDVSVFNNLILSDGTDVYGYGENSTELQEISLEANTNYEWATVQVLYNNQPCILNFIKTSWPDV